MHARQVWGGGMERCWRWWRWCAHCVVCARSIKRARPSSPSPSPAPGNAPSRAHGLPPSRHDSSYLREDVCLGGCRPCRRPHRARPFSGESSTPRGAVMLLNPLPGRSLTHISAHSRTLLTGTHRPHPTRAQVPAHTPTHANTEQIHASTCPRTQSQFLGVGLCTRTRVHRCCVLCMVE